MKFQVERQTKILPISAIQIFEIWDKYRAFKNWDTLKRRSLCSVKFEKFEKLAPVFKVDHTSDESRKDLNGMVRTGI